jgi:hypothetical protein
MSSHEMYCDDASSKVSKDFDYKIQCPFGNVFKFAVAVCTAELYWVFALWILEFDLYKSISLATNNKMEKNIFWH